MCLGAGKGGEVWENVRESVGKCAGVPGSENR